MKFNERLKELRSVLGLSQAALSVSLGIPKRTIENWEAGSRIPASWVQYLLLNELEMMRISYKYENLICKLNEKLKDELMNLYLLEAFKEDQKRYDKLNLEKITLHKLLEELEKENKLL